jgi:thiamine biosynthesis protein ThiC
MNAIIWDIQNAEVGQMIGGPGVHVQIDESKFGVTKYHKGRKVQGVWVLGK